MEQVTNARSAVLNLYYLVREYAGNGNWTENFGEIVFEIANNPFGVYSFYLQIYLRMFFIISWSLSLKKLLKIILLIITLASKQFQR